MTFAQQITTHYKGLRNFAFSLCKNDADADDLAQHTVLKALKYEQTYTDGTKLRAWLYTIAKNSFINDYRRNTKFRLQPIDGLPMAAPHDASGNMAVKTINALIDTLPAESKTCFTMHTNGYKYKEIAEHLDIPIGTVKSRIFLAKKQLQTQLTQ